MIQTLDHFVRTTDAVLSRARLSLLGESNALRCFIFHSIFRDPADAALELIDPLQKTTLQQFREFIEHFLAQGYYFVSPNDVLRGLPKGGRFAMVTFDDGYYNNSHVVPILEAYGVPATFFISINHVLQHKCFWWDVLYRERRAQKSPEAQIECEARSLKSLRNDQIETLLIAEFGSDALQPRGDIDRPFTPRELRQFAASPCVHLGNHTADHAILTNYDPPAMRKQIGRCQHLLQEITGEKPVAIAYPNGNHSDAVVAASQAEGLRLGFTIRPCRVNLPTTRADASPMRLGRFCLKSEGSLQAQCMSARSDLPCYALMRDLYLRLARGSRGH